jgi:hypothetical protein
MRRRMRSCSELDRLTRRDESSHARATQGGDAGGSAGKAHDTTPREFARGDSPQGVIARVIVHSARSQRVRHRGQGARQGAPQDHGLNHCGESSRARARCHGHGCALRHVAARAASCTALRRERSWSDWLWPAPMRGPASGSHRQAMHAQAGSVALCHMPASWEVYDAA